MSENAKPRYGVIDSLRGFIIINMVLYHLCWDLVNLFHVNIIGYNQMPGHIWQKCICCGFILISGFCCNLSRNTIKRGLIVFAMGAVISLVTILFMPDEIILFGILTFLGSAMIITGFLKNILIKIPPVLGLTVSILIFVLTFNLKDIVNIKGNLFTAYLGFPFSGFVSYDWFPLIPWIFLYISGFYLYFITAKYLKKDNKSSFLRFLGRHSLLIYVLHQPVVYFLLYIIFFIVEY